MSHTPGLLARVCMVSNAFTPYTENPEKSFSSSPKGYPRHFLLSAGNENAKMGKQEFKLWKLLWKKVTCSSMEDFHWHLDASNYNHLWNPIGSWTSADVTGYHLPSFTLPHSSSLPWLCSPTRLLKPPKISSPFFPWKTKVYLKNLKIL